MERENSYPGLDVKASELSAFGVAIDVFVLSLKNRELVRFTPDDPKAFRAWLSAHGVRDVDQAIKPKKKQSDDIKPKRKRLF